MEPVRQVSRRRPVATGSGGAVTRDRRRAALARSMNPLASVSRSCLASASANAGSESSVRTREKRVDGLVVLFSSYTLRPSANDASSDRREGASDGPS